MSDDHAVLTFPCRFPIKAMGRAGADLEDTVRALVGEHAREAALPDGAVRVTQSRNGRFVSVTVTVWATSRAQLDAIYRALHGHNDVLMTL